MVVKPDIVSKTADTGSVITPESMNGSDPRTATESHPKVAIPNPSRLVRSIGPRVIAQIPRARMKVSTPDSAIAHCTDTGS